MKRIFTNIECLGVLVVLFLSLTACRDDLSHSPCKEFVGEGQIHIRGSVSIPEAGIETTRGDVGITPNADLKLTLLEFDLGTDAAHSFLTNIYHADLTSSTTAVSNGGIVNFEAIIMASASPKVFHIMLTDDFVTAEGGTVATVLPSLTVANNGSNDSEAYWGRIECPDGLIRKDDNGDSSLIDGVEENFNNIPIIRNFARISVTEDLDNFELLGFDLVNVPTAGTIAPWDQGNLKVPELLDGSSMKKYSHIDYKGIVPGGALFRNSEANARRWDKESENMNSTAERYMYEHPFESFRRTYVIIYGRYISGGVDTYGFYKVDIGRWDDGEYKYYNILRNINYRLSITSVSAPGMATVAEAINSAPFNNLSASVETEGMLNISDGVNLLVVDDTNHIIVDPNEEIKVLYRYIENIGKDGEEQRYDIAHTKNLIPGPVIKSWTETPIDTVDGSGTRWQMIKIQCNNPTDEVKTQSFSIINGTGLSRTIHLTLRNPWRYAYLRNSNGSQSTYRLTVSSSDDREFPYEGLQPIPQTVSANSGQPLTVYFALPDGLPETMFPLDFRIEAKYQGIENNKIDNMVVYTGPSLFNKNVMALSFIKTVTYEEYSLLYSNDDSTELDPDRLNTYHTIACRFLTINSVDPGSEGDIIVYNEYFRPNAEVKFLRQ